MPSTDPPLASLPCQFIRECHRSKSRPKVADSSGMELSGGSLLMRSLIFRRLLLREVLDTDEEYVGLLLPPSGGAVLANAALTLCRRVAVNLNYTVTSEILNDCIRQCDIRHVLSSRKFMEKMNFQIDVPLIYLEDFREKVRLGDKLSAAWDTYVRGPESLERRLGLDQIQPDDVMTVIFTSGSTGQPKGVMLTYRNIQSNVEAVHKVVHLRRDDVMASFLPFFHSFGYTLTLWTVLSLKPKGVYHYSPLDAKLIGKLCEKHRGTILLSTPTFLRGYFQRCKKEELQSLEVVVTGAEKLPRDLIEAFEKKFGVRPVEGYGTTELSPLVSVNIPPSRDFNRDAIGLKDGSVGRPIPGVEAKVVHLETGKSLPTGESGMLWIRGPNVMKGYLGEEEMTTKVIRDGWYMTGDIAFLDDDGFIFITGRESRFSKIGGEMVPHVKIEEEILRIVSEHEEEVRIVVTAVPDVKKGERLIVLFTEINKTPEEIRGELSAADFPNIWIPAAKAFYKIDSIPVLGTGKLDLRAIKSLALEVTGSPRDEQT